MIRRFGESVKIDQKYKHRPGVYAVLVRGSDILLTYQEDPEPEYQLPGGGIDPGEHPLAALHREVYEETGWSIEPIRRLGAYRRFCYMPDYEIWAEKVCTLYLGRPIRRLGPPTEQGHEALWSSTDTAAQVLTNAGERHCLQQMIKLGRI